MKALGINYAFVLSELRGGHAGMQFNILSMCEPIKIYKSLVDS